MYYKTYIFYLIRKSYIPYEDYEWDTAYQEIFA